MGHAPKADAAIELEREAGYSWLDEKMFAGVPARVMVPRIIFIVAFVAWVAFGLVMQLSASSYTGMQAGVGANYEGLQQIRYACIGLLLLLVVTLPSRPMWETIVERICPVLLLLFTFLVIFVHFFGETSGGSTRWINISGFSFQPSEFAKPFVIVCSALIVVKSTTEHSIPAPIAILFYVAAVCVPCMFILVEPDTGTVVIILVAALTVLLFSDLQPRSMALLIALVVVGAVFAIPHLFGSGSYTSTRVLNWQDPWRDVFGDSRQAAMGIIALSRGGMLGCGLGASTLKLGILSQMNSDYVLATVGEEIGFVGICLLLAIVVAFVGAGLAIANNAHNKRDALIALGCTMLIAAQAALNAAGVFGVIPLSGKPFPFLSNGGSSLLVSFGIVGLILRVSIESGQHNSSLAAARSFRVYDGADAAPRPHPRKRTGKRQLFKVVDGKKPTSQTPPAVLGASAPAQDCEWGRAFREGERSRAPQGSRVSSYRSSKLDNRAGSRTRQSSDHRGGSRDGSCDSSRRAERPGRKDF